MSGKELLQLNSNQSTFPLVPAPPAAETSLGKQPGTFPHPDPTLLCTTLPCDPYGSSLFILQVLNSNQQPHVHQRQDWRRVLHCHNT